MTATLGLLALIAAALFGTEQGRRRRYYRAEERRHAAHFAGTGPAHAEALTARRSRPVRAPKPPLRNNRIATVDLSRVDA